MMYMSLPFIGRTRNLNPSYIFWSTEKNRQIVDLNFNLNDLVIY